MLNHPEYTNYKVGKDGTIISPYGKVLKSRVNESGYVLVSIKDTVKRVHRLVGETYLPNLDNKPEINHKDGCKTNNHLDNLEWVTSKENKRHAWENKLYKDIGEDHIHAVHTNDTVHEICRRFEDGQSNSSICKELNVPKHLVAGVRSGSIWRVISDKYNFTKKKLSMKTDEDLLNIADHIMKGLNDRQVAEATGFTIAESNRVRNKNSKSELLKDYDFPKASENRMTPELVNKVCVSLSEGLSIESICEKLGTRPHQVKKLRGRRTFTDISRKYVW